MTRSAHPRRTVRDFVPTAFIARAREHSAARESSCCGRDADAGPPKKPGAGLRGDEGSCAANDPAFTRAAIKTRPPRLRPSAPARRSFGAYKAEDANLFLTPSSRPSPCPRPPRRRGPRFPAGSSQQQADHGADDAEHRGVAQRPQRDRCTGHDMAPCCRPDA